MLLDHREVVITIGLTTCLVRSCKGFGGIKTFGYPWSWDLTLYPRGHSLRYPDCLRAVRQITLLKFYLCCNQRFVELYRYKGYPHLNFWYSILLKKCVDLWFDFGILTKSYWLESRQIDQPRGFRVRKKWWPFRAKKLGREEWRTSEAFQQGMKEVRSDLVIRWQGTTDQYKAVHYAKKVGCVEY